MLRIHNYLVDLIEPESLLGCNFFFNTKSKEVINIIKKEKRWKTEARLGH